MSDTLIIYHANCLDGFGAAYAAREHFKECPQVAYHPGFYQSPPPDIKGKHVIMVDFSSLCCVCVWA